MPLTNANNEKTPPIASDERIALTRAQHLLWLSQSLVPDIPLYNLTVTYTIDGALDIARFQAACNALVAASGTLQSVVVDETSEQPMLRRDTGLLADCELLSLGSENELQTWITERRQQPLNPCRRVFDCALVSLASDRHVFYWNQHHISTDGSNIPLILGYLSELYEGLAATSSEGHAVVVSLPSYHEYIRSEEHPSSEEKRQKITDYWQAKSAQITEVPEFFGRPFDSSHAKVRKMLTLSEERHRAIEGMLQQPGFKSMRRELSLFALMTTVMMVTGYRLHRKTELNLGFPTHARHTPEMRKLLGMVVGVGFLNLELDTTDSFRTLAKKVMREIILSFSHIEPGLQTKETQQAFTSSLNILQLKVEPFAGFPVSTQWHFQGYSDSNSQLDVNLIDFSGSGQFEVAFDMALSVFSENNQACYIDSFSHVLDVLLDNPDSGVCEFPLVRGRDVDHLLNLGKGPDPAPVNHSTLHSQFSKQSTLTPHSVAVKEGDKSLSFAQVEQQSDAIAAFLRERGVKPGDAVGSYFKRSIEMVAPLIGIMKAGAAFVPLDPSYPADRLSYMVENSALKVLLSNVEPPADISFEGIEVINVTRANDELQASLQRLTQAFEADSGETSDALYISYTSGSTGRPKGVIGTHSATLNRFNWMWRKYPFQSGEVACQKTALSFVDSIWEMFGPLLQGVPVVIVPDDIVLDIFAFVDLLEAEQVSRLVAVPSFLTVLIDSEPNIAGRLRALEYCTTSGEALPLHIARDFMSKMGHCTLLNLYGSTEVSADVTADTVSHDKLDIRMPIGRPIDGVTIYILDDTLKLMPQGCVGEICIAGLGLSAGYFNAPELNADKFVDNPYAEGRLFRTGDLGRLASDGLIAHHGRRDMQLKVRGHRIESAEIEHTALEYEHVKAAIVFCNDDEQLYLFYVVANGEAVDEEQLKRYMEDRLPAYMIPKLVKIALFPVLPNGKVNRKGLKLLVPVNIATQEQTEPRSPTEEILAQIWQRTFGLEQIDIHGDFFDMGGNSITAMRIMVEAKKSGIDLSLKEVLEIGNIAGIAMEVDNNPLQHRIKMSTYSGVDGAARLSGDEENLAQIEVLIEENTAIRGRGNVSDVFHLTSTQKGILFHLLLQGQEAPLYLCQVRCDLIGELDIDLFKESWNSVVQRHGMLRSVFLYEGLHEAVQVIVKRGAIALDVRDVRDLEEAQRREACEELSRENLGKPIDLSANPLVRVTLIILEDKLAHMIFDWNHILMDGWSLAVISNEIFLTYGALTRREKPKLLEVGRFKDHVVALNQMDREVHRTFWEEKLKGFDTPTLLSTQPANSEVLYARSNKSVYLDEVTTERLLEFSRQCRVTLNTVVQAAWALLLSRYNDTDDVLFSFAVTGRTSGISHYENTVGMFVNSLPMRIHCDGSQTLVDWLQMLQKSQMDIVQHENSSLVDTHSASDVPTSIALFDSLLVFQNVPKLSISADFPLEFGARSMHENSPMPLTIEVFPADFLELQIMYIEEMFVEHSIDQIISHFTNLIRSIATREPSSLVSSIEMISDAEISAMTETFNDTVRDYPLDTPVTDLIWQRAKATPMQVAVRCEDEELNYQALTERADSIARYILQQGVKPNGLVGVCIDRGIDMLVALLGVLRAGAAYVPLDPDYPQNRIDSILLDAKVVLLVTTSDTVSANTFKDAPVLCLDTQADEISVMAAGPIVNEASGENLAYVIYTSGSTGTPKGVRISRRNMANFLHAMCERPGLGPEDSILAVTTVSFDIAVLELYLPLLCGACVDIATLEMTYDGLALKERIENKGITCMQATPTTWRLLLAADWEGGSGFKALVGGEPLPRDLAATLIPRLGSLWNMYGPTETTVWSSCDQVLTAEGAITVGKPIGNTEILILDGSDKLCPVNIPGELCIAGEGVAKGYVNRDELTQEKFVPHPLRPDSGELIYRTGDLAKWLEDGRLDCLGRIDSQVKLRGFRIELGEIESVLSEMPGISHAVVALVRGQGTEFLGAYVVFDSTFEGILPNELEMRERLRESLPMYMIPSTFMVLESIPRTPNGKIDRKALPNPNSTSTNLAELANIDVYDLPENQAATETERKLREIWESVIKREKISVNSDFFDMGGNSITAMLIMSSCKKQGIELSIMDIFNLGSIRLCADSIDKAAGLSSEEHRPATNINETAEEGSADGEDNRLGSHAQSDLERIAMMLKGRKAG